ncbi:S9 family peptidase [Rhodohalobacter sp. SW132]|uniref:S9 family peptidase n=1 Tax=Rhodohalobacter sp. SW132 TaxID=2293433 RepID=UPI000E24E929|nr:S9 family peptidase [Rhodohalobacter sp. SW132]REL33132.1 S9 family peptidase [Rhodohalobacter sp. SW132]
MRLSVTCKSIFSILILFICFSASGVQGQNQDETLHYQSLQHALFSAGQLSGLSGPQNVTWIDGGERYSYMIQDPETRTTEIRAYNPTDQSDELILNTSGLTFPDSDRQFEFRSFQWSADFRYLVFQSNFSPIYRYSGTADYYYYSIEDESLDLIAGAAFTAELSPDGRKVAYHRDGEMFVFDLESGEETQLTFDSEENLYNGRFGWVYEEEFGLVQAWKWSNDSRYIAYWQSDEDHVERFVSTDYEGSYPEYTDIPYPKVGSENPVVNIGVIDTETGENRWMDLDIGDGLIPRIYWTSNDGELAVVWMNRQQNQLQLHFHDATNGSGEMVMEEKSDAGWIDVYDFFAGIDDYFFFPENRDEFLWISDRNGYKHLYRYSYSGDLMNQVTDGDWEVTNVFAVNSDKERIYYESTEESPLERHLYSIRFDGSGKNKYTETAGRHSISMGPDGKYFIDTWSNVETPTQVELRTTENGGDQLEMLVANERVKQYIEEYNYSPRELFSFTTEDGQELDGYMIRPPDFDPEHAHPLIMMIYGGPSSQGVYNQFETNAWVQYLAQEGFVIANVNNRGSGGYGRDFEKVVYENLGEWETYDVVQTAKYLGSYDWVDQERMAIRGHSYGGYVAALSMVLHPGVFQVGLVGAPVTDWRLYDTIYTERYMGLLEENEENYTNSSVMEHARNFTGNMLVAHSSMDENVHIQNTMQMLTAFTNAGKDIDVRIYPPGAHGVAYNQQSYLLLHQVYTRYLNRHLK